MNEQALRRKLIDTAKSYLGCKESDGSHRPIIDLYNSHRPLARGYTLTYTDDWCAGFVSAMAIACGLTQIMPTEVGCGKMIDLYKAKGSWVEDDAYVPKAGDVIFFDWEDNGTGDNRGSPNHVGLVADCDGKTITTIEGNRADAVGCRTIGVNARYIRGYGTPDFASMAEPETTPGDAPASDADSASPRHYRRLAEVRSSLYRSVLLKLIEQGVLLGRGGEDEERIVDLSEESVRLLVMLDRAGCFDLTR